jgi:hypothetical protein
MRLKKLKDEDIISIEVVAGVEGPSLYINQYRIVGNKPWGGGRVLRSWKVSAGDLRRYLRESGL